MNTKNEKTTEEKATEEEPLVLTEKERAAVIANRKLAESGSRVRNAIVNNIKPFVIGTVVGVGAMAVLCAIGSSNESEDEATCDDQMVVYYSDPVDTSTTQPSQS